LRLKAEWVLAFLENPQAQQPGTLMPDLLHGLPLEEKRATAEALTHYLVSLQPVAPRAAAKAGDGSIEKGRALYHSAGCVACHAPQELPAKEAQDPERQSQFAALQKSSVPMGNLPQKYPAAELAYLLREQLATRPSGRMPSCKLNEPEAAALSAYLLREGAKESAPQPAFAVAAEKAQRGRELFTQLNCGACHPLETAARKARPLPLLRARQPSGCVSAKPSPKVPRYEVSDRQRVVLLAALGNQAALEIPLTPAQQVKRTMTTLNCYACHHRDRRGGLDGSRRVYFTEFQKEDALPPSLVDVGGMLSVEDIAAVLREGKRREGFMVRMPQFGVENVKGLAEALVGADTK
jgi:cytochrome c551/c552